MEKTYEEVVKYNIDEAIKIRGEKHLNFATTKEWLEYDDNNPAKIPNNPLLTDYDYVYEHAEEILCQSILYYQQHQSTEAYYTLFKAITNKYPLEEDYNKILYENNNSIKWKWRFYASTLINFLYYSFDDRIKELLSKPDVINYFLRYPKIFTIDTLTETSHKAIEALLENQSIANYYIEDYNRLIQLIRKQPKITIPYHIMLDDKIIKDMARTPHIEEFYYKLHFIREQVSDQPFLDEHAKYCDEQINAITNGILPVYQEEYQKAKNNITYDSLYYVNNSMQRQVMNRIFKRTNQDVLPKDYIYQELSKYMIIGMFISRNFQTDPYNLLIDIKTLQEFAKTENRTLKGQEIYDFLVSFEDKSLEEIIKFYEKGKTLPLMDILYDDWNNEKERFIDELNSSLFALSKTPQITKNGITYYDISDIEEPILVHNTSIPLDNEKRINEMIEQIKKGHKHRICLSVQDQNHNVFYKEEQHKKTKTIKFAFGTLEKNKVGTIYHKDAYSQGISKIEFENFNYKRRLYTLKTFMDQTSNYNEINYLIKNTPFLPIGIICEDEITEQEQEIAKKLNIPILYRKTKESTYKKVNEPSITKRYTYTATKSLF